MYTLGKYTTQYCTVHIIIRKRWQNKSYNVLKYAWSLIIDIKSISK